MPFNNPTSDSAPRAGGFPWTRLRRLRRTAGIRRLVRETRLSCDDLIWPLFALESERGCEAVGSLPGVERLGARELLAAAERALDLGIPAIALFPVIDSSKKTADGREAWNPEGLLQQRARLLKKELPELILIADVALDPFTTHGQDGVLDEGREVDNDRTLDILVRQALSQAEAGIDVVAPSDMMDGRIRRIREALEGAGHHQTLILSYAAKYASCFYGPFRDAVGSDSALGGRDKSGYQMDPANSAEAMREIALDIEEGADIVMVKPGLPFLDILRCASDRFDIPLFAYQVSGEYSMMAAAAANGWLDLRSAVLESLLCLKRGGAQAVFSYWAPRAAEWLRP